MGLPVGVTLPRILGMRPSYCSRSDEQPAVQLLLSMLRLEIARMTDWNGSAVDAVSKALARFCRDHGIARVSRAFPESTIRVLDDLVERSEYELVQSGSSEPSSRMFLMVDYCQAAMVQIGPTLALFEQMHKDLPGAFYRVFTTNLGRWMWVYDFQNAEEYAEDEMNMMEGDEEGFKESFLPQVKGVRPAFLNDLPDYEAGVQRLMELRSQRRHTRVSSMIHECLELHRWGDGQEAKWPSRLRDKVPEMEDYLENTDGPGPGALIVFHENDPIEACFSEQTQHIGQNYPIGSTAMLLIDLDQDSAALDQKVAAVFDYLRAMLRSLSSATRIIESIRGIYYAELRQRRMDARIQAEPGAADVRPEQL